MKKIRVITLKLLSVSLLFLFIGCEKFKLLKDEDMDLVPAGENTRNATFASFIRSNNYHQNDKYSQLRLYAQAVKQAGLEDFLDNPNDNFTIVMFTDAAMSSLVSGYGYALLEEVPPMVLRHFILNNIIQDRYSVVDLPVGDYVGFKSLTGDSVYFRHETETTDPYLLRINKSPSASVMVRARDLPFKNAIGHVANAPTYTFMSFRSQDDKPDDLPIVTKKAFVEKDVYLQFNTTEAGYTVVNPTGDNMQTKMAPALNNSTTRRVFLQYNLPDFNERLGRATLMLYHTRSQNGVGAETLVEVYWDEYKDWLETSTYSNLPAWDKGALESSIYIPTSGSNNTWVAADISGAVIQAYENQHSFINMGVWSKTLAQVFFGHLGHANAATNKSYILLESTPETIIANVTVNPVNVSSTDLFKKIDKTNLTATGASDNNISYFLKEEPQKGIILVNGMPLKKRGKFTQQQLSQGVVRYLPNQGIQNTTDEILLEVQDFHGGFYPNILTLPVQIN